MPGGGGDRTPNPVICGLPSVTPMAGMALTVVIKGLQVCYIQHSTYCVITVFKNKM